ncbi:MAG: hypothetical protein JKY34_11285 [Kordiimonadaceae bacterium]|nr:hypothetical protein [Kordiimonadaceae bacterium]
MFEVIRTSSHKAHKQHQCDNCGYPIEPGENYRRQLGKFEGEPYSNVEHQECVDLASKLFDSGAVDVGEGYTFLVDWDAAFHRDDLPEDMWQARAALLLSKKPATSCPLPSKEKNNV